MDEISYYSDDDESVCVGLTFTPAIANKRSYINTIFFQHLQSLLVRASGVLTLQYNVFAFKI